MPRIIFSRPPSFDLEAFADTTGQAVKNLTLWQKLGNRSDDPILRNIFNQTATYLSSVHLGVSAVHGGSTVAEDILLLSETVPLDDSRDLQNYLISMLQLANKARDNADQAYQALRNVKREMDKLAQDVELELISPSGEDDEVAQLYKSFPIHLQESSDILFELSEILIAYTQWWNWIRVETDSSSDEPQSVDLQLDSLKDSSVIERWKSLRQQYSTYIDQIRSLQEVDPLLCRFISTPEALPAEPTNEILSRSSRVLGQAQASNRHHRPSLRIIDTSSVMLASDAPLSPFTNITPSNLEGYKDESEAFVPGGFGQIATYWPSPLQDLDADSVSDLPGQTVLARVHTTPYAAVTRHSISGLPDDPFPGSLLPSSSAPPSPSSGPSAGAGSYLAFSPLLASIYNLCSATVKGPRDPADPSPLSTPPAGFLTKPELESAAATIPNTAQASIFSPIYNLLAAASSATSNLSFLYGEKGSSDPGSKAARQGGSSFKLDGVESSSSSSSNAIESTSQLFAGDHSEEFKPESYNPSSQSTDPSHLVEEGDIEQSAESQSLSPPNGRKSGTTGPRKHVVLSNQPPARIPRAKHPNARPSLELATNNNNTNHAANPKTPIFAITPQGALKPVPNRAIGKKKPQLAAAPPVPASSVNRRRLSVDETIRGPSTQELKGPFDDSALISKPTKRTKIDDVPTIIPPLPPFAGNTKPVPVQTTLVEASRVDAPPGLPPPPSPSIDFGAPLASAPRQSSIISSPPSRLPRSRASNKTHSSRTDVNNAPEAPPQPPASLPPTTSDEQIVDSPKPSIASFVMVDNHPALSPRIPQPGPASIDSGRRTSADSQRESPQPQEPNSDGHVAPSKRTWSRRMMDVRSVVTKRKPKASQEPSHPNPSQNPPTKSSQSVGRSTALPPAVPPSSFPPVLAYDPPLYTETVDHEEIPISKTLSKSGFLSQMVKPRMAAGRVSRSNSQHSVMDGLKRGVFSPKPSKG